MRVISFFSTGAVASIPGGMAAHVVGVFGPRSLARPLKAAVNSFTFSSQNRVCISRDGGSGVKKGNFPIDATVIVDLVPTSEGMSAQVFGHFWPMIAQGQR